MSHTICACDPREIFIPPFVSLVLLASQFSMGCPWTSSYVVLATKIQSEDSHPAFALVGFGNSAQPSTVNRRNRGNDTEHSSEETAPPTPDAVPRMGAGNASGVHPYRTALNMLWKKVHEAERLSPQQIEQVSEAAEEEDHPLVPPHALGVELAVHEQSLLLVEREAVKSRVRGHVVGPIVIHRFVCLEVSEGGLVGQSCGEEAMLSSG